MHTLVKTACAIHNLSLATAFGGPLFLKAALKGAVLKEIKDEKERGRVLECAITKYNRRLNVPAHLLFTGTWLIERNFIMKLHVDERTQKLVAVKDVLIAGAFVTGIANVAVFKMLKRDFPEGVPVRPENEPVEPKLQNYRRYFRAMGPLHLALVAGSIAIGPAIGAGIYRSQRRNLLSRLLGTTNK
jgi:hypothetical protein